MITSEQIENVVADPTNARTIGAIKARYRNLHVDTLTSCIYTGAWKCLQKFDPSYGQSFSSSLFRFINWECLRESRRWLSYTDVADVDRLDDTATNTIIVTEYLDMLDDFTRGVIIDRYMYGYTLQVIGDKYGYSKTGIKNIINRGLTVMRGGV